MNIKWPENRETFDAEGYKQGYNDARDACKKAVEEAQKQELTNGCPACGELYGKHNKRDKYKANFCFGNNDPFDDLMYEFANAHTEEYREEVFKNIKEMFKQEPELMPLDDKSKLWKEFDKRFCNDFYFGTSWGNIWRKDIKDWVCSKFGVPQQEKLVELDEKKLWEMFARIYYAFENKPISKELADMLLNELLCELATPKPRPVVTVDKLADIVQNAGADWENLHDPITPFYVYIAQAIFDYLNKD